MTTTLLASSLMACSGPATSSSESATDYEPGTVVRVIDGDTLVITFDGSDQTVRLLNVDTPETKQPNRPVECLGAEAAEKLESLTPPGTKVALDFDVERTDKYDRVLAAVFVEGQTLVNAELARVGLGIPVLIEPNSKYYDGVQAAYDEAAVAGIGLLDPAEGCTLPAEVADAAEALTTATDAPMGETATAAAATAAGIVAALTTARAARETLDAGRDTVRVLAVGSARAGAMARDLDTQIAAAEQTLATVSAEVTALEDAEAEALAEENRRAAEAEVSRAAEAERVEEERIRIEAAEAARVEAERVQADADARTEADRLAAEAAAAEQERIQNLPPVPPPVPYIPPVEPYIAPAPPAAQDPYPGYTGPRCYAPGGKTYRPC